MITRAQIWLPWPPSVWKLYGKRPSGKKYRTKEYDDWRREAGWLLKTQKIQPIVGPVSAHLRLTPPDKRQRDADNYEKAAFDLLVNLGVIQDDNSKILRSKLTEWADDDQPGIHLTITSVLAVVEV